MDDLIVTGNHYTFISKFIPSLPHQFSVKDLGSLHHFLGVEVFPIKMNLSLNINILEISSGSTTWLNPKKWPLPCPLWRLSSFVMHLHILTPLNSEKSLGLSNPHQQLGWIYNLLSTNSLNSCTNPLILIGKQLRECFIASNTQSITVLSLMVHHFTCMPISMLVGLVILMTEAPQIHTLSFLVALRSPRASTSNVQLRLSTVQWPPQQLSARVESLLH